MNDQDEQATAAGQTVPVGVGLLVLGVTAYGFLLVSARALGPREYASLSALWALAFLVGPGFFLPLEQEVGRSLATRRAQGFGGGRVLARAAALGGLVAGVLLLLVALLGPSLLDQLFDHQGLLLAGLVLSLVGYFAEHLARGELAGRGRFTAYGLVLGLEGTLRLLGCAGLALAGASTAGPYGLVLGAAPLVAALVAARRRGDDAPPGPDVHVRDLTASLGWLVLASVAAQVLVNAGPLAVKLLATDREAATAGRFLAGLVLARVPLFLFQAVQASLLPRLARLQAAGRHDDLRVGLRRLVLLVLGVSVAALVGAGTVGPDVLGLAFGSEFRLGRTDLLFLTGASAAYLLTLTLAQPLIALSSPARVAVGWLAGVVAFAVTTAATSGLLARVEWGFLAGSLVAAATMGGLLVPLLGEAAGHPADELAATIRDVPLEP